MDKRKYGALKGKRMKHAREDYNRIQDPEGKIPEDEPVFLIRGQDLAGPQTLREWARVAEAYGASEEICNKALAHADAMIEYQRKTRHKVPDL